MLCVFKFITGSSYRNLLIEMLLNIRIKSPKEFANMTIGERFGSLNWKDSKISQLVQDQLYFGMHNNVCLAHGRVPIIPVRIKPRLQQCRPKIKLKFAHLLRPMFIFI